MKKYIVFLICILLGSSCSEVIEVKVNAAEESIVIYGYITSEEQYQTIQITHSTAFTDTSSDLSITEAKVSVGSYTYSDSLDTPGYYRSDVAFKAEQGQEYTLTVNYDFDGDGTDEIYTASTTLSESSCVTGASFVASDMMGIVYYTPYFNSSGLKGEEYWYIYFTQNDQKIYEGMMDVTILEASTLVGSEAADNIPLVSMSFRTIFFSTENEDLAEMFENATMQPLMVSPGETLYCSVCAISEGFYEFLSVLKDSTGSSNPIFGSGAVFLPTNFSGGAMGYFGSLMQTCVPIVVPSE